MAANLRTWEFWRPCLALALALLFATIIDFSSLPDSGGHLSAADRLPRLVGALTILAIAGLLAVHPEAASSPGFRATLSAVLLCGIVCFAIGALLASAPIVRLSAFLMAVGCEWLVVMAYVSVTTVQRDAIAIAIIAGFALSALACLALAFLPPIVRSACLVVAGPLSLLLASRDVGLALEAARPLSRTKRTKGAPSSLAIVARLLLLVFLYEVAYGFSLHATGVSGIPLTPAIGLLPAAVLLAYLLLAKRDFPYVATLVTAIIFAIAGLLVPARQLAQMSVLGTVCIAVSVFLFLTTMRYLFCVLGKEDPGSELAIYAASVGISGFGFVVGSVGARMLSSSPAATTIATSAFLIVFCIVCTLTFTNKGIAAALDMREMQVASPSDAAPHPTPFKDLVRDIAAEHGLSPREAEVFFLLARGRNREHIQEKLVISKDTAKAHIKHVYAKLGVHSQQELIDLVEQELEEG